MDSAEIMAALDAEQQAGRSRIKWALENLPSDKGSEHGPVVINDSFTFREYVLLEPGARNACHHHVKGHHTFMMRGAVLVGTKPAFETAFYDEEGMRRWTDGEAFLGRGEMPPGIEESFYANSRDGAFHWGNDNFYMPAETSHFFIALEPTKFICAFSHYNAFGEPTDHFEGIMKWTR